MLGFEGLVVETGSIGARPGVRYRCELMFPHNIYAISLVYMIWNPAYEEPHLFCYFHRSAGCQCVYAVTELRKQAGIDTDKKD